MSERSVESLHMPSASPLLKAENLLTKVLSGREGRVDGSEADVAVDDRVVCLLALDIGGHTGSGVTSSTANTGGRGVLVDRVGAVEPEHVGVVLCFALAHVSIRSASGPISLHSSKRERGGK